MADKGISELIAALGSDSALAAQLGETTTVASFIAGAADHGYVITEEDLAGNIDNIPLSEAQLSLVGGGGGYGGGGGGSDDFDYDTDFG